MGVFKETRVTPRGNPRQRGGRKTHRLKQSDALAIASDESSVLVTAFRAQGSYALHVLNLGLVREAVLAGLPDEDWRVTQSTESKQFESRQAGRPGDGTLRLQLPARSLVTLTTQAAGNAPSSGGR